MTGNLKSRNLHGTEEHFFYDTDGKQLNRLAGTGPDENTVSENYAFADNGNITNKAGMGPYIYDNDRKNAVSQVGIPPIGGNQDYLQTIQYNHFNSASEIKNLEDDLELILEYGPDDQRRLATYWDESGAEAELIKTRIYAGAFEKQIYADLNEIEVHYISAGGMLVAMYVVEDGVGSYYYPHQDHLGSIIHLTDETGAIVYTQSFDPWGRTRNPNDLSYINIPVRPDWLWRGYTGHEHLDEFGLINMNGRLYDPVVGRMLSPDNYVQSPNFSQSYNRYSYVFNNPLKYYDPSGELAWFVPVIVGAVVGAYTGASIQSGTINPTQWESDAWKGAIVGGIIGAGAGLAASAALPSMGVKMTTLSGTAAFKGTATTGFKMATQAIISGNISIASNTLQGRGLEGAWKAGLIGVGSGLVSGGVESVLTGSEFFSNALDVEHINAIAQGAGGGAYGTVDRYIRLREDGVRGSELAGYTLLGFVEGAAIGGLSGGAWAAESSLLAQTTITNSITSFPGLGYSVLNYQSLAMADVLQLSPYLNRQTPKYPRTFTLDNVFSYLISLL